MLLQLCMRATLSHLHQRQMRHYERVLKRLSNRLCNILQVASPEFFLKMIPLMDDGDDVAMVLSPQCFHNTSASADIFNHSNIHFWE